MEANRLHSAKIKGLEGPMLLKKKVCHAKTKIHLQKQMEGMCMWEQFRHLHNAILAKDSHIAPFPGNVHNLKAQQTTDLSTVDWFPWVRYPNEAIEN